MKKFWTNEPGSYKIAPDLVFKFLVGKGFYIYKPTKENEPILIRDKNNRVAQVSAKYIRRYCSDYIRDTFEFQTEEEKTQVINEYVKASSLFSKDNLDLLPSLEINEVRDTKETSYMFFRNCLLEITAEGVVKKTYDALDGHVWEKDVIQYDFDAEVPSEIIPCGEFHEFFKDITKHDIVDVQRTNRDSLVTIIGYLLHRYKNEGEAKAIIFMDTYSDGYANGGTGKGLLRRGLEQIRHTAMQDGKLYKSSDKFAFSNLTYGTRILAFDDVPSDFNFEKLFPLITEKAVVERKYENKFVIPFKDSPKVMITTNYTIEGKGSSHRRRKIEFILSDTYNDEYTPEDRFSHLLFAEWEDSEWGKFYLFMTYCIQMYLLEGIVKPRFNVAERTLKLNAPQSFISWATFSTGPDEKFNKKDELEDYQIFDKNQANLEQNTFTRWMKLYADAFGYKVKETHSGSDNFIEFLEPESSKKPTEHKL